MIRTKAILIALAFAPFAIAQTDTSANRLVTDPPTVGQSPFLDAVFKLIGPFPAETQARPEKFHEFIMSVAGPVPLLGEAAGAAIGQGLNAPKEWGQGWGAFGKRFGSNLAYNGIRQSITYGGSLALGEDTRYFSSDRTGFWPRTRHALVSPFAARHYDNQEYFSVSNTAGVLGASALASVWGPGSWKGPGNMAENAGISFASTAACNFVREFLPEILHRPRK